MIYTENEIKKTIPSGYSLVSYEELKDADSAGVVLKHDFSGARICVMPNGDENKLFCAAFRTPPRDDCGTPHIIEHSVLCGSERYPVKDPFMQLAKSSMQTFLNAMTYADKTLYPVSSCNDADFRNLMNIYLDAVFAPNISKRPEIFMQEGWHYEPEEGRGLSVGGVVYSEMKGAVSSPDSNIYDELIYALFPDTPYGKNSGGDPEAIPTLSYEAFLDFYNTYYHPSNSYIMLYGNMDVKERLEYLDREYLSKFPKKNIRSEIPVQTPFGKNIKDVVRHYPIGADDDEEEKTFLAFGVGCADSCDVIRCYAYEYLSDILLEMPGAPVKTALTKAGIGQEIYGGFINHLSKPVFSVIAKNTDSCRKDEFLSIIRDTLENILSEGVNKKSLLASITRSEYSLREGEQRTASHGLSYFLGMLQSWLYDDEKPFIYLNYSEIFKRLRELSETDYFEGLIRDLLDGDHSVILTLAPEKGLNEKNEEKLKERLSEFASSLSDTEYKEICDKYEKYVEYQDKEETEDELSCIPTLERSDIPKLSQPVFNREGSVGDIKAVFHDIPTNGLVYLNFIFDISHITPENLPYVNILSSIFGKVNTGRKYEELLDDVKMTTGGLSFGTSVNRLYGKYPDYNLTFDVGLKMLSEKAEDAVSLAEEIIFETDFSDVDRISEIIDETVSEMQRDIISAGSEFAAIRAASYFSSADAAEELIDGISGYESLLGISDNFDSIKVDLPEKLRAVAGEIFCKKNLLISIGADNTNMKDICDVCDRFGERINNRETFEKVIIPPLGRLNEGIMTPSQVQYAAMCSNLSFADKKYNGLYLVLTAKLKNDYLYPAIRMKGGAYGYSCTVNQFSGGIVLSTYRDPNLSQSLEVFRGCGDFIRSMKINENDLTSLLIGVFGRIDRPLTPYMKVIRSLQAYRLGYSNDDIQRTRDEILGVTPEMLKELADGFDSAIKENYFCVIGNEEKIKKEKNVFLTLKKLR